MRPPRPRARVAAGCLCKNLVRFPYSIVRSPGRREGNSMIRSLFSTIGAALLLATSAYAQEPPPLRTAVDGTFAPHAFPNLSGGYQGFNIDLANEIAKRL